MSGIALAGIYYSIAEVNPKQSLVAYKIPADRADAELTHATAIMGMTETGRRSHALPGYAKGNKLVRVRAQVGQVMKDIIEMPGARLAIEGMRASRVTGKSLGLEAKEQER